MRRVARCVRDRVDHTPIRDSTNSRSARIVVSHSARLSEAPKETVVVAEGRAERGEAIQVAHDTGQCLSGRAEEFHENTEAVGSGVIDAPGTEERLEEFLGSLLRVETECVVIDVSIGEAFLQNEFILTRLPNEDRRPVRPRHRAHALPWPRHARASLESSNAHRTPPRSRGGYRPGGAGQ